MLPSQSPLRGILLLIIGVSFFALVDGISKVLVDVASFWQIVFARYALSVPLLWLYLKPQQRRGLFVTQRPVMQVLRALAPMVIGGAMVIAVGALPLAEATVILFAGPFLVVALSGPLLGEKVSPASWVGVVLGFIALLLVMRPGLSAFSPAMIYPLIAALFFAIFQLMSGSLAKTGERWETTLAYTLTVGTVIAAPMAALYWNALDWASLGIAILLSLVFAASHLFVVMAYQHAPANLLAPFTYAQIIAATLFGLIVFGALPDAISLLGIALMIAAGVYVARLR